MLIVASSNNDNTNNNYTCIYNDGLTLPRRSKIRVHSCVLSTLPTIVITSANNTISFRVEESTNVYAIVLTLPSKTYTPQQLASEITLLYYAQSTSSAPYSSLQMECRFDNLTGCFSFYFYLVSQPVSPILHFQIKYHPTNLATSRELSKIMGFGGLDQERGLNAFNTTQNITFTADNSVSFTDFSNILLLNVDNINIKNENNKTKVSLNYVDVIQTNKALCQNNTYINQFDKSYTCLKNDDPIELSSLNISIRNLDGSLCSFLDTTKSVSIILEVKNEDEDEMYMKRELQRNYSVNPFLKK